MRALATRASAASACSGSAASRNPGWKTSTAMREATSPACAPPMPSATTYSGARASSASSLARRWRPVSVPVYCSATRSILKACLIDLEAEFTVADAHTVAGVQRARALQQLLVEVGAVGRSEVFDHDGVALLVDERVARGGERVLDADLGVFATTEHEPRVEVVDHPGIVPWRALDDQARRALGDLCAADRGGRVQAGCVGRDQHPLALSVALARRRERDLLAAEIAAGAAYDPQDEQQQHGEEAEL